MTADRISSITESVFGQINKLAAEHGAINLSQGAPDFDGPIWLSLLAKESITSNNNQYANPFYGRVELRLNLQKMYQEFYGLTYDLDSEITVTNGATQGIFLALLGLINPGDEVIVFEPFYDSYLASILMAGGIAVPVTLKAPSYCYDPQELSNAFSKKTKMVIFNSPQNPTGKVFTREEMQYLADLCHKHNVVVISDEVYEHLTFDGAKHIPLAALEGMKERTITISSAGKTFGMTGWKIGWMMAPPKLSSAVRTVLQYNTFSVSNPFQIAIAKGLEQLNTYLPEFKKEYLEKRNFLYEVLVQAGFRPSLPEGTYFITCQIDHLGFSDDVAFVKDLIQTKKVAAIPPSSFYLKSEEGKKTARFCFAKTNMTLEKAKKNLLG